MDYLSTQSERTLSSERSNSRREVLASEAEIVKTWLRERDEGEHQIQVSYQHANSTGYSERTDLSVSIK